MKTFLIFLLMIPTFAIAGKGGVGSGGGGNTIQFDGQPAPFLIDRLSLNPLLSESLNPSKLNEKTYILKNKLSDISPLLDEDRVVFEWAKTKLQNWQKIFPKDTPSYSLVLLIMQAIDRMAYLRTNLKINTLKRYFLDEKLKAKNPEVRTAILYLNLYGSIISSPAWDILDLPTKGGLIIHESIRQIQGIYGYFELSDLQLQLLTATIVDVSSEIGSTSKNVDLAKFMSPELLLLCQVHGASRGQDTLVVDKMMAGLVLDFFSDLHQAFDSNQKNNSIRLQKNGSKEIQELIDNGILSR